MTPGPASPEGRAELEEVLTALSGSGTLALLGLSADELQEARKDPYLFETLKIIHELLVSMRNEGVLGTFLRLPKDEQANFIRVIGSTDDEGLRRNRTGTFVAALKQSPLADSDRYGAPE